MTLESKAYVADDSDVKTITKTIVSGVYAAENGSRDYLRALVATTQSALGAKLRVNMGKPGKLDAAGVKAQLAALDTTHDRFYKLVTDTATEAGWRGVELNRRTNFARTALYSARVYVRAGNDLTSLAAGRLTKATLAVTGRKLVRPLSLKRLKTRAEKSSKALVASLLALGEHDQRTAAEELELLMNQLTDQLAAITGAKPTKPWKALKKDIHARTQILSKAQVAEALSVGGAP